MSEAGTASPRRWPRRLILIALVVGLAWTIMAFRASHSRNPIRLPVPNGYDDLVQAGASRQGDWPNQGELAKATIEQIRPFVEANEKCLGLARAGLDRECQVPIEDTQEGLNKHFDEVARVRDVSRIFELKARVLEAEGRTSEAVEVLSEFLELGQVVTQGGMAIDAVGWSIQEKAIERLRGLRQRLSVEDCKRILGDLDGLDRRRVSSQALFDRWLQWYEGSYGSIQRGITRLSGMEAKGRAAEKGMVEKSHARIERSMRFYQIELAIHLFYEQKQTWPRKLEELVPTYLASIPIDSSTGKPLEYPANPAGELTDELESIAQPDGSIKPQP